LLILTGTDDDYDDGVLLDIGLCRATENSFDVIWRTTNFMIVQAVKYITAEGTQFEYLL
jgi:hypothetical protein